jgi:hypothetical protein
MSSIPLRGRIGRLRRALEQRVDQGWALAWQRLGPAREVPGFDGDPRFAVVTVNFSTTAFLKLMLLTLSEQSARDRVRRVVVVDNASRDGGIAFLRALARRAPRISLVENRILLNHARGMRRGLRFLDELDAGDPVGERANLILSVDTDVIFRNPETLIDLAQPFIHDGAAAAGELRHWNYPYPEAQASFLAVRRDIYARRDLAPWVNHGAPAYWLQRSLWQAGEKIACFPSNAGAYVLHRGRSGVAAAGAYRPLHSYASEPNSEPHFMRVPDGAEIWAQTERRLADLLSDDGAPRLLDLLAERFA